MSRTLGLGACVIAVAVLSLQVDGRAQTQALVIRNVTLIDGTGAAPQAGADVVVTGNHISAVGRSARVPAGAQVVDGSGKFLIPGLWDMHVHPRGNIQIPGYTTYGDILLLTNGITGVHVMAGLPIFYRLAKDVEAGRLVGPRMSVSSRIVDGLIPGQALAPRWGDTSAEAAEWMSVNAGEVPRAFKVTTEEEARDAVAQAKAAGAEYMKVHNELTPEAYFALAKEAKAAGLYLAGHLPTGVSVVEMSDTGTRSIEHFPGMLEACSTREAELLKEELKVADLPQNQRGRRNAELQRMAIDSFDEAKCTDVAKHLAKNNTWLSPTFLPPNGGVKAQSQRLADLVKYVPNPLRGRWQQQAAQAADPAPPSAEQQQLAAMVAAKRKEIVTIMRRNGVMFVPGTDEGGAWRIPGRSLHEDLIELNNAGLTPMQVIEAATSSSAKLLRRDKELGTVQTGKLADMVLLDANPLEQIANTQKIDIVVMNGRLMDRKMLDALLGQLAASGTN